MLASATLATNLAGSAASLVARATPDAGALNAAAGGAVRSVTTGRVVARSILADVVLQAAFTGVGAHATSEGVCLAAQVTDRAGAAALSAGGGTAAEHAGALIAGFVGAALPAGIAADSAACGLKARLARIAIAAAGARLWAAGAASVGAGLASAAAGARLPTLPAGPSVGGIHAVSLGVAAAAAILWAAITRWQLALSAGADAVAGAGLTGAAAEPAVVGAGLGHALAAAVAARGAIGWPAGASGTAAAGALLSVAALHAGHSARPTLVVGNSDDALARQTVTAARSAARGGTGRRLAKTALAFLAAGAGEAGLAWLTCEAAGFVSPGAASAVESTAAVGAGIRAAPVSCSATASQLNRGIKREQGDEQRAHGLLREDRQKDLHAGQFSRCFGLRV